MNQIPNEIIAFLHESHVLALATSDDLGLWAANCFYAFDPERMALIILSHHETRHAMAMRSNPRVAGTVSKQDQDVALIRGIQFAGAVTELIGNEAKCARVSYDVRFPFARDFEAPIWSISLDALKLTDNQRGFGFKQTWKRPDPRSA